MLCASPCLLFAFFFACFRVGQEGFFAFAFVRALVPAVGVFVVDAVIGQLRLLFFDQPVSLSSFILSPSHIAAFFPHLPSLGSVGSRVEPS